ncbi:MAG: type IV conjugative transfer system protein TraL, partial [Enterococcus faecalis]|nr:type IV conjugative transfer system protein TraL [Enterococcus faecalis]
MENNYTYRFPYRINLPLLILFFDAKQIGVVMGLLAFGNIFECMTIATVTAVVYWVSYNKAKEGANKQVISSQADSLIKIS